VACSRDVVETSQAVGAIEANDGFDDAAAEEAAAIVVDVKAEVDAGAQGVSAVDPGQVVDKLRRGDGASGMRREAEGRIDVESGPEDAVVGPDRNLCWIREIGIGLAKGEDKGKAIEAGGEFIDQGRGETVAVAEGQI